MFGLSKKSYINQICQGLSPIKPEKAQYMVQFYFEGGIQAYCHSLKSTKDVDNFIGWAKKTVQGFKIAYVNKADGKNLVKTVKGY